MCIRAYVFTRELNNYRRYLCTGYLNVASRYQIYRPPYADLLKEINPSDYRL